jgi:hypothetical protein
MASRCTIYYGNEAELAGGKSERFLAQNLDMERQIQEITAVADLVQGLYDLNEPVPYGLWTTHPDFCAQTGGFQNYETAPFDSEDNRYFTDTAIGPSTLSRPNAPRTRN